MNPVTVTAFATAWLEHKRRRGEDVEKYETILTKHILPHIGGRYINTIVLEDLDALAAKWPHLHPSSIRQRVGLVRTLCGRAARVGYRSSGAVFPYEHDPLLRILDEAILASSVRSGPPLQRGAAPPGVRKSERT